jgi:hypothetical protein
MVGIATPEQGGPSQAEQGVEKPTPEKRPFVEEANRFVLEMIGDVEDVLTAKRGKINAWYKKHSGKGVGERFRATRREELGEQKERILLGVREPVRQPAG